MTSERAVADRIFIRFLESLVQRKDRAALAALRRGSGHHPAAAVEAYGHVMPRVAKDIAPRERDLDERIYLLAASLFAFHQISWPMVDAEKSYTNFGASMARLASATESAGVERRMNALLASSFEDLPEHLRHAVSLLKAKQVGIDWTRLISDLRWWNDEDRRVQREWARAFWASTREETEETESAEENGEDANVR
jgi:CRISPR system Cascade subunit CasB